MKDRVRNKKVVENLLGARELYELGGRLKKDDLCFRPLILLTIYNGSLDLAISSLGIWHRSHVKGTMKTKVDVPHLELSSQDFPSLWRSLDAAFKKEFKASLPYGRQMIELKETLKDIYGGGEVPVPEETDRYHSHVRALLEDISASLLKTPLMDLDRSLMLEHKEVADVLHEGYIALRDSDFQDSIRQSTIAFSLALEIFRQEINELSRAGMLNPSLFLLERPVPLQLGIDERDILLLALGYDQELYERFTSIVPTTILKMDEKGGPQMVVSDFSTVDLATEENAHFCLDFVSETVLRWEALDIFAPKEKVPRDLSP